jgi:hypothetical protein
MIDHETSFRSPLTLFASYLGLFLLDMGSNYSLDMITRGWQGIGHAAQAES